MALRIFIAGLFRMGRQAHFEFDLDRGVKHEATSAKRNKHVRTA